MPPKKAPAKAKPCVPKDLCIYVAEADEDGVVPDETISMIRYCVIDKIFADNPDHIEICRTDSNSSFEFKDACWDMLRKVESKFRETRVSDKNTSLVTALIDMCEIMGSQAEEDSYEFKKMLAFGLLKSEAFDPKEVQYLGASLKDKQIKASLIVPNKVEMNDQQLENYQTLKKVLECKDFENFSLIVNKSEAKRQIFNSFNSPSKRSMPWNIELEIGPNIRINVSSFVCTRKNTMTNLKKAVIKEEKEIPQSNQQIVPFDHTSPTTSNFRDEKKPFFEIAKNATDKETIWKEKDDTVVDQSDIGKAYSYGGQLIPFNEFEQAGTYKSGEKCLKVLVFCPKANILPEYQQGDGTSLIKAKKGDSVAQVQLDALMKAMHNKKRVAVVRKVYRNDSSVKVGYLTPDLDRKCLVYGEVCFADDVSVPHFPILFKPRVQVTDEDLIHLTKKEEMMDEYIMSRTLDSFHPFEGPTDPAAANMRTNIARKILDSQQTIAAMQSSSDNIDIYFDEVVSKNEILDQITEAFPLKINKEQAERASGATIFRKRITDGHEQVEEESQPKRLKLEDVKVEEPIVEEVKDVDYEDLLDQI